MIAALLVCLLVVSPHVEAATATAYFSSNNDFRLSNVGGSVTFTQATGLSDVTVSGTITGLLPGDHGFHVHLYGDTRLGGTSSTGAHFNVTCATGCDTEGYHGWRTVVDRHAGDMGNITADATGVATVSITLSNAKMSLSDSLRSIIGRTIVVHRDEDEGPGSQPTGNSGPPVAYGKIGIGTDQTGSSVAGPAATVSGTSAATYALANMSPVGAAAAGGALWITAVNNSVSLVFDTTGLTGQSYSVGIFSTGVQNNATESYGNIIAGPYALTTPGKQCYTLPSGSTVHTFVGRSAVLFNSQGVSFSNVVSMGIVGFANTKAASFPENPFACMNGAANRVVSWLVLLAAAVLVAL